MIFYEDFSVFNYSYLFFLNSNANIKKHYTPNIDKVNQDSISFYMIDMPNENRKIIKVLKK